MTEGDDRGVLRVAEFGPAINDRPLAPAAGAGLRVWERPMGESNPKPGGNHN